MALRRDPLDGQAATGRFARLSRDAWDAVTMGQGSLGPRDPIVLVLAYTLAVSLIFVAFPTLDIAISGLFYGPAGFAAAHVESLIRLRMLGDDLIFLVLVAILAAVLGKMVWPGRPIGMRPRSGLFLIAALALGPGLVVNGLFKSFSGRPRPIGIEAFGGPSPFVPAWRFSDYCSSNCSFISGEASSAIWLMGLVFLAPKPLRPILAVPIGALVLALSLNRIAFGGHFASDVLISFGFTLLVMILLYRLIVASPFGARFDAAVEAGLARTGRRLRARFR